MTSLTNLYSTKYKILLYFYGGFDFFFWRFFSNSQYWSVLGKYCAGMSLLPNVICKQPNPCKLFGQVSKYATLIKYTLTNIVPLVSCHQKGNLQCIFKEANNANKNKCKTFHLMILLKYPYKDDMTPTAFIFGCYIIYRGNFKLLFFKSIFRWKQNYSSWPH